MTLKYMIQKTIFAVKYELASVFSQISKTIDMMMYFLYNYFKLV